jgi:sulfite reductase (NADPH) flavoprotein alpha-component
MSSVLSFVPMDRLALGALVVVVYLLYCGLVFLRHQKKKQAERRISEKMRAAAAEAQCSPILIVFASQTGFAEDAAWKTAASLQSAGEQVQLISFAKLDAELLRTSNQALFLVSTTGEGDAPDSAAAFVRKEMAAALPLSHLRYGLLSLGDRTYKHFCAFGRTLDRWLEDQNASKLFETVEVDNCDEAALTHWQKCLASLNAEVAPAGDWSRPDFGRWKLVERRPLNSGSPGGLAFHVVAESLEGATEWRPGDIAEVNPCNSRREVEHVLSALNLKGSILVETAGQKKTLREFLTTAHLPATSADLEAFTGIEPQELVERLPFLPCREYSIASLPEEGRLELLVRQVRRENGRLGLGSGWLTEHAPLGAELALRVRENRNFHPPQIECPLILIGNGTGMAGLRAHLKARARSANPSRNWLLFGERTSSHDFFYREEIEGWLSTGLLERLDIAFSRDQTERIYVQHCVAAASDQLREWVDAGAAIYVCGSLEGMAEGVSQALKEIMGQASLDQLTAEGRYRRDVY